MRALRHRGVGVVLVRHRDVVEDVLLVLEHAPHAVLHDGGQLVAEAGIVGHAVGHDGEQQVAGAVLVLQALARERGATGGGADQEAPAARVAGRPDQVADAPVAEGGIEDVEGQHRHAVGAVAGRGGDPGGHGAGLGDALLQDLALAGLLVVEQLVFVLRLVELADRGIDGDLPEERLHAEGARLVGNDGHQRAAERRVAQQVREELHEHHGRGLLAAMRALQKPGEGAQSRRGARRTLADACRQIAAERLTAARAGISSRGCRRAADRSVRP